MFETLPVLSVVLFGIIAGSVLQYLGFWLLSEVFFRIAEEAIVLKALSRAEHPLTRICLIGYACALPCVLAGDLISTLLGRFLWIAGTIGWLLGSLGNIVIVLASLGLLVRLFMAIFLHR